MRTIGKKAVPFSAAKEDYVRAIYLLQEKTGRTSVTDIAKRLNLSKSTVSERIKDLVKNDLVVASPYSAITLTATGLNLGQTLTYKHRVIEVFLHKVLKMPNSKIHAEAEKLEHACSDEVIKRLSDFLNNPTTDPHGTKISIPKNW